MYLEHILALVLICRHILALVLICHYGTDRTPVRVLAYADNSCFLFRLAKDAWHRLVCDSKLSCETPKQNPTRTILRYGTGHKKVSHGFFNCPIRTGRRDLTSIQRRGTCTLVEVCNRTPTHCTIRCWYVGLARVLHPINFQGKYTCASVGIEIHLRNLLCRGRLEVAAVEGSQRETFAQVQQKKKEMILWSCYVKVSTSVFCLVFLKHGVGRQDGKLTTSEFIKAPLGQIVSCHGIFFVSSFHLG